MFLNSLGFTEARLGSRLYSRDSGMDEEAGYAEVRSDSVCVKDGTNIFIVECVGPSR